MSIEKKNRIEIQKRLPGMETPLNSGVFEGQIAGYLQTLRIGAEQTKVLSGKLSRQLLLKNAQSCSVTRGMVARIAYELSEMEKAITIIQDLLKI